MTKKHWAGIGSLIAVLAILLVWFLVHQAATKPQSAPATRAATTHAATRAASTRATSAAGGSSTRATGAHTGGGNGGATDPQSGLPWIDAADLPPEGRETLALIDKGGPFPYPNNDGVVFTNAEGVLPKEKSGYYHEYTVPTPGASNRATRRIVTGSNGEFYYTDDHYQTFKRIRR